MARKTETLAAKVAIAGGGPAGIMAGYLLARAGIDVVVLEKHKDFLRDFRGDTVHPSTLDIIAELGLLDAFLKLPHQEIHYAEADFGGQRLRLADLSHLPTRCKFIALMPQWDFLDFLADRGRRYDGFRLLMETEALDLRRQGDRITGLAARGPSGRIDIAADLVIAADGRSSILREAAGLTVEDASVPLDVLWFRLDYGKEHHNAVLARVAAGQMLVMLDRGDYQQCALVIRKGTAEAVKREGLEAFRRRIASLAGRDSVDEIKSLDDVKLLTVKVDRLKTWHRPGLLVIGDAAHAMSPIGGVGINLAIQDAVATANILAGPLQRGAVTEEDLARVQERRLFPTRATQKMQVLIQDSIIEPVLTSRKPPGPPWPLRLLQWIPVLQRLAARILGVGFRPEHVDSPESMIGAVRPAG